MEITILGRADNNYIHNKHYIGIICYKYMLHIKLRRLTNPANGYMCIILSNRLAIHYGTSGHVNTWYTIHWTTFGTLRVKIVNCIYTLNQIHSQHLRTGTAKLRLSTTHVIYLLLLLVTSFSSSSMTLFNTHMYIDAVQFALSEYWLRSIVSRQFVFNSTAKSNILRWRLWWFLLVRWILIHLCVCTVVLPSEM